MIQELSKPRRGNDFADLDRDGSGAWTFKEEFSYFPTLREKVIVPC